MKYLILIIGLFLVSCDPQNIVIKDSSSIPYYEIMEKSKQDTIQYKMVKIGDDYFLLNENKITYKIKDYSANFYFLLILVVLLLIIVWGVSVFS